MSKRLERGIQRLRAYCADAPIAPWFQQPIYKKRHPHGRRSKPYGYETTRESFHAVALKSAAEAIAESGSREERARMADLIDASMRSLPDIGTPIIDAPFDLYGNRIRYDAEQRVYVCVYGGAA